jgi:hypothetical protein
VIDNLVLFLHALGRALRDLVKPRTWAIWASCALSLDGLVFAAGLCAEGYLLTRATGGWSNALAQFGVLLLVGLVTFPFAARLFTVAAARSAAGHHPGLRELAWPSLFQVAGNVLLPTLGFILAGGLALFLALAIRVPAWLVGAVLFALAAILYWRPLFRLATHLYLEPDEASRVLNTGKCQGVRLPGFGQSGWLMWTGLLIAIYLAAHFAVAGLSMAAAPAPGFGDLTPRPLSAIEFALYAAETLIGGLLLALVLAHLYLPGLADALAQHPMTVPFVAARHEEGHKPRPQSTRVPRPAVDRLLAFRKCPIGVLVSGAFLVAWGVALLVAAYHYFDRWGWHFSHLVPLLAFGGPVLFVASGILMPFGFGKARWLFIAAIPLALLGTKATHVWALVVTMGVLVVPVICLVLALGSTRRYFRDPDGSAASRDQPREALQ